MLENQYYLLTIISLGTGLLGLLGSVGIFISLIIQRKVERLQDILEELIEQAYLEDQNLTGSIYRTVQKYQMHYLIPEKPVKTIMFYVDATITMVILIWLILHLAVLPTWITPDILFFLFPALGTVIILFFFRKLLRYAINPLDNPLLNGIIPPPAQLRSISFLSGYVNVSVKALLKQVRFNILVQKEEEKDSASVILKEELSFDDFFYYLSIGQKESPDFVGFGRVAFSFSPDPITGKPCPLKHNINLPLGFCPWSSFEDQEVPADLLLFLYGEKHPIHCSFSLVQQCGCYISLNKPEAATANSILYKSSSGRIILLENKSSFFALEAAINNFDPHQTCRYYLRHPQLNSAEDKKSLAICEGDAFID